MIITAVTIQKLSQAQTARLYGLSRSHVSRVMARYRAEVVPQFWLFTRRANCRIFQGKSADEILKLLLEGLDVAYELTGSFPKRDYCVQYRETDFAFASRLMEEEGIFYFFKNSASTHKLVIANAPAAHADVPGETHLHYDELAGGGRDEFAHHRVFPGLHERNILCSQFAQ